MEQMKTTPKLHGIGSRPVQRVAYRCQGVGMYRTAFSMK